MTSGATWRIGHEPVSPPGGYVMYSWRPLTDKSRTITVQILAAFFKCRHLADRSCTSGALLRTSHELVLSKFVRLIF